MREHNHEVDDHCIELFGRLSEFLDGEADAAVAQEIEANLAECEECRSCMEALKAARGWVRGQASRPVSKELKARLRQAAREFCEAKR